MSSCFLEGVKPTGFNGEYTYKTGELKKFNF